MRVEVALPLRDGPTTLRAEIVRAPAAAGDGREVAVTFSGASPVALQAVRAYIKSVVAAEV